MSFLVRGGTVDESGSGARVDRMRGRRAGLRGEAL